MQLKLKISRQSVYNFVTHLVLAGILVGLNNCTPTGFRTISPDPFLSLSSNLASNLMPQIETQGKGISEAFAPGCTPSPGQDFMEQGSWDSRRVEPADCAISFLSTPIFVWPRPSDLNSTAPMTLTITRPSDGKIWTRTSSSTRLLFDSVLASGTYQWQVAYTNNKNLQINSQKRTFVVAASGLTLALPSGSALARKVSGKAHPRALPLGSTFQSLATKAQAGEYKTAFAAFLRKAQTAAAQQVPAPPANLSRANFNSDTEFNAWLLKLMHTASDERSAIETMGYAGLFLNSTTYDTAAINRLMALTSWDPQGITSEAGQDQANREIYLALGLGLDLFQNKLSVAQRQTIVSVMKNRLNQTMSKFAYFDRDPYDSHLLTATYYTTEALMYAAGTPEFPESSALLATSWESLVTTLGPWGSSRDGGFGNGGAYGWFAMTTVAHAAAAVRLLADLDLTRWPAIGKFGDNQIAQYPAAAYLRGSFGDDVETNHHYFDYSWDAFRLYANVTGKAEYEWYWRADPRNLSVNDGLQPMHYLMLGIRTPRAPVSIPALKNSWLFEDAGFVAIHSKTTDSLRSSLMFRSSRLGSLNHSHADNNAFTFVSKGKELLISGGYYPYYNSPHHALVGRATRFKNALTFDGGIGQSEPSLDPTSPGAPVFRAEPRGQLINFADNGAWAFSTGDATLAYRGYNPSTGAYKPLLTKAIRTVAYNRNERVAIIYDWATSSIARNWELNFQTLQQPLLDSQTLHVINEGVEACVDVYGLNGSFAITSGFPVAPEKTFPDQFQSRYTSQAPSNQLVSVTVIREDCREIPVDVRFSDTQADVTVNNSAFIRLNQKTVRVY